MHIDIVSNRDSRPVYLLRESYRDGPRVRKRTLANLSAHDDQQIDAIRRVVGRCDRLERCLKSFNHCVMVRFKLFL